MPIATLERPDSVEAEAYRALRTNLAATAGDARAILVAAPSPGSGTSTAVANLAVAAARSGQRVVVVDADLRHGTQSELFEVAGEPGLVDVLEGKLGAPDALKDTSISGLRLLPAGRPTGHPADALSHATLAAVIEGLKASADWVLVDAPAVLSGSDAATVARHVDGVLVVLGVGHSRKADAARTREALDRVGAPILGSILLGVDAEEAGFGHFEARSR